MVSISSSDQGPRGRHSSTEPELGWDVSLCIPGEAGIPLAKLLIFNKYNLFCISYHNERNISRPSVRVVSICVSVLGLWHQTGQHKQLSLLHWLVTRYHGSECASMWHVGVPFPSSPDHKSIKVGGTDSVAGQTHPKSLLLSSQTWQQLQSIYLENPQR